VLNNIFMAAFLKEHPIILNTEGPKEGGRGGAYVAQI
jgi:hypothetical protein